MSYSKEISSKAIVVNIDDLPTSVPEGQRKKSTPYSKFIASESVLRIASDVGLNLAVGEIGSLKHRELLLGYLFAPCESIFRFHIFYLLILNDISQRSNKPICEITLEDVCMFEHQHMCMKYPVDSNDTGSESDSALIDLLQLFTSDILPPTKGFQRQFFRNTILTCVLHCFLGEELKLQAEKLLPRLGLQFENGVLNVIEYKDIKPAVYSAIVDSVARIKGKQKEDVSFDDILDLSSVEIRGLTIVLKGEYVGVTRIASVLDLNDSQKNFFKLKKGFDTIISNLVMSGEFGSVAYQSFIMNQVSDSNFRMRVLEGEFGTEVSRKLFLKVINGDFGRDEARTLANKIINGYYTNIFRYELLVGVCSNSFASEISDYVIDKFGGAQCKVFRTLLFVGVFGQDLVNDLFYRICNNEMGDDVKALIIDEALNGVYGDMLKKYAQTNFVIEKTRAEIVAKHRRKYIEAIGDVFDLYPQESEDLVLDSVDIVVMPVETEGEEELISEPEDLVLDSVDILVTPVETEDEEELISEPDDLVFDPVDILVTPVETEDEEELISEPEDLVFDPVDILATPVETEDEEELICQDMPIDDLAVVDTGFTISEQIPRLFKRDTTKSKRRIIRIKKQRNKNLITDSSRYVNCVKGYAFEQLVGVYLAFMYPNDLVVPQYCLIVNENAGEYSLRADFRVAQTIYEVKWGNATDNILDTISKHKKAINKSGHGFYYKVFMCVKNPSVDSSFYTLFDNELESNLNDQEFFANLKFILSKLKQLVDLHDVKILKLIENALNAMVYKMLHGYIEDRRVYLTSVTSEMVDVLEADYLTLENNLNDFIKRNLLTKRMSSFAAYFEYQNVIYSGFLSISIKYDHMEVENVLSSDLDGCKPNKINTTLDIVVDKPESKDDIDSEKSDEQVFTVSEDDGADSYLDMLIDEYDLVLSEKSNLSMSEFLRKFRGVLIK